MHTQKDIKRCPVCQGHGRYFANGLKYECPTCKGSGENPNIARQIPCGEDIPVKEGS